MKSRPRKIVTCAIVFLFAGAIINVAVAWLLYRYPKSAGSENVAAGFACKQLQPHIGVSPVLTEDQTFGVMVKRPGSSDLYCFSAVYADSISTLGLRVVDAGWPTRSLHGEVLFRGFAREYLSCIPIGDDSRFVPIQPIWPGFAINTVFYAAVLGAMFLGPGMVRRAARHRRGLCPACGYPVGQNPVCTECGAAVSPRRGSGM